MKPAISNALMERIRAAKEAAMSPEDPAYQAKLAAWEASEAADRKRQADADLLQRQVTSGIPRMYWPILDAPQDTPAIAAVRELFADSDKRPTVVILGGPKGRGKTSALCWAAWRKRGGVFLEAQDTFRLSSFAAQEWAALAEAPVLSLDECGAEFHGEVLAANLFSLLNARIQNLRPTALATNLNPGDFKARFLRGPMERLDDRFRACGTWVSLPGESMRKHWSESPDREEDTE